MANQKSNDPSRQVANLLLSDRPLTAEEITEAAPEIALKNSFSLGEGAGNSGAGSNASTNDQPAATATTDSGAGSNAGASPTTTPEAAATDTTTNQGEQSMLGLGAGDGGASTATEQIEQQSDTSNVTVAAAEGITITNADGSPMTEEQVLRLSGKQKIQLDDGTVTDIQTLRASGYFKHEFDNRVRALNQEKQELDRMKQAAAVVAPYASAIEQSQFGKAYLENFRITGDESRALAAASAATGIALPSHVQSQQSQEPKKLDPSMDEYYEQDPAALGIEYATPEWDQFILKGSAALARLATRRENDRIQKEASDREAARLRVEQEAAAKVQQAEQIDNTILDRNYAVLQRSAEIFADERKIDISKLSDAQKEELAKSLTETFISNKMMVTDKEWLKNNFLDEIHLRYVARATPFGQAKSSPAAPLVVPPTPTTAATTTHPVSAGVQSHSVPARESNQHSRVSESSMHRGLMNQLLS